MRTFQHKVTINDIGAILVFGLGAFFCLWHRTSSVMIVLGVLLIVVTIRAVDRAIHTSYVLTDDDQLRIKTGRIGQTKSISISDIRSLGKHPFAFYIGHYILIELVNGNTISVQPDNADSFQAVLTKRMIMRKDEE